jgi:uncharacterized repeat protein (TIGR03803 family)
MCQLKFGAAALIFAAASALTTVSAAQVQYRFKIVAASGSSGTLALDEHGNLYGTTTSGGIYNAGTVFELTPSGDGEWAETTLYNFSGGPSDGFDPTGGLAVDRAGNLYGVTTMGGLYGVTSGFPGTAFELTPGDNGWTFILLHTFCSLPQCADGEDPVGNLVLDEAGNLDGMTELSPLTDSAH